MCGTRCGWSQGANARASEPEGFCSPGREQDAAQWSCGVARAVESGVRGRRSCICTRAVAHRAGGQHWAADTAGQGAILASGTRLRLHNFNHTPHDFLRSASGAEMVVSKLERLALKAESYLCLPFCASIQPTKPSVCVSRRLCAMCRDIQSLAIQPEEGVERGVG